MMLSGVVRSEAFLVGLICKGYKPSPVIGVLILALLKTLEQLLIGGTSQALMSFEPSLSCPKTSGRSSAAHPHRRRY